MNLLCISHNIFLTREQRYKLYEGENVDVVGISVPVWFYNKNETNEPAIEVFCKYNLKCENRNFQKNIEIMDEGYEITLFKNNIFEGISDKIKKYFKLSEKKYIPTTKSLLDIKDGGSEWLSFKAYDMNEYINIIHSIEIQKIENLLNSLVG